MSDAVGPLNQWAVQGTSLLDLGCGRGEVLQKMRAERDIRGTGMEIDANCLQHCLECGLDVLEQDLNHGLDLFGDDSFDLVLAKDVLHYAQNPEQVLKQMLRVGKRAVVSFDNYGWWWRRLIFLFTGDYRQTCEGGESAWYHQQSFNLFSVADFEDLCRERGCIIEARRCYPRVLAGLPANLFSRRAWYLIRKP